jgi:hypothetical protein
MMAVVVLAKPDGEMKFWSTDDGRCTFGVITPSQTGRELLFEHEMCTCFL